MRVLLVCTANICRSPMAQGVLERLLLDRGLSERIRVDSAATQDYFEGAPPEVHACEEAAARGLDISALRARTVTAADFDSSDLLLAMDRQSLAYLQYLAPPVRRENVRLFMSFADRRAPDVPDPYRRNGRAFKRAMDIIERGAAAVVEHLVDSGA